jgi:hypothetical protein
VTTHRRHTHRQYWSRANYPNSDTKALLQEYCCLLKNICRIALTGSGPDIVKEIAYLVAVQT